MTYPPSRWSGARLDVSARGVAGRDSVFWGGDWVRFAGFGVLLDVVSSC